MGDENVNPAQWNALMDFFCDNRGLVTNQSDVPMSNLQLKKLWMAAAAHVNKVPGARKTGDGWKEAWKGLKTRCKTKYANKTGYMFGTGGGPSADVMGLGLQPHQIRCLTFLSKLSLQGETNVPDPLVLQVNQGNGLAAPNLSLLEKSAPQVQHKAHRSDELTNSAQSTHFHRHPNTHSIPAHSSQWQPHLTPIQTNAASNNLVPSAHQQECHQTKVMTPGGTKFMLSKMLHTPPHTQSPSSSRKKLFVGGQNVNSIDGVSKLMDSVQIQGQATDIGVSKLEQTVSTLNGTLCGVIVSLGELQKTMEASNHFSFELKESLDTLMENNTRNSTALLESFQNMITSMDNLKTEFSCKSTSVHDLVNELKEVVVNMNQESLRGIKESFENQRIENFNNIQAVVNLLSNVVDNFQVNNNMMTKITECAEAVKASSEERAAASSLLVLNSAAAAPPT